MRTKFLQRLLLVVAFLFSSFAWSDVVLKDKFGNYYFERQLNQRDGANKFAFVYTADPHGDNVEENIPRIFAVKKEFSKQKDLIPIFLHGGDEPMDWPWAFDKHRGIYKLWAEWDAYAIGNHDLMHFGDDCLIYMKSLVKHEQLPLLATNIIDKKNGGYPLPRYKIIKYEKYNILVVGLVTQVINNDSRVNKTLYVESPSASYNEVLRQVKAAGNNIDKVIILSHMEDKSFSGVEGLDAFLKKISGKDVLIFKGHEHKVRNSTMQASDGFSVPVLCGGTANNDVKVAYLNYYPDKSGTKGSRIISDFYFSDVNDIKINADIPPLKEISEAILTYKKVMPIPAEFKWLNNVIFDNDIDNFTSNREILNRRPADPKEIVLRSPLTALVADAFRSQMNVNFSLMESTNVRRGLNNGPVTGMDILRSIPFLNKLVLIDVSGRELENIINEGLLEWDRRVHYSGLKVAYDETAKRFKILKIYDTETQAYVNFEYDKVYKGTAIDNVVDVRSIPHYKTEKGILDVNTVVDFIRKEEKKDPHWELGYKNLGQHPTPIINPVVIAPNLPSRQEGPARERDDNSKAKASKYYPAVEKYDEKFKNDQLKFLDVRDEINAKVKTINDKKVSINDKIDAEQRIVELSTESNTVIIHLLEAAGVKHELAVNDFGKVGKVVYIKILPEGDHYLNRVARFFKRFGVETAFSQKILSVRDVGACFYPMKMIFFMNYRTAALFKNKSIDVTIHELIHTLYQALWDSGYESNFLGYVSSSKGSINSKYGAEYDDYVALDELAAYAENNASYARKFKRAFNELYFKLSPEYAELGQILNNYAVKMPYSKSTDILYDKILDVLNSFILSSAYNQNRDLKLTALVEEFFQGDKAVSEHFLSRVTDLYGRDDLISEIVPTSRFLPEAIKRSLSTVKDYYVDLYESTKTSYEIAGKLEYVLTNFKKGIETSAYRDVTPSEDYDGAFGFNSGLTVQFKQTRNKNGIPYYIVSYFFGDLEYTTIVNDPTPNNDGLAQSFYEKLAKNLKFIKEFKNKDLALLKEIYNTPFSKDPFAEDFEKEAFNKVENELKIIDISSIDVSTFDLQKLKESTVVLNDMAEKVRQDYLRNIAVGVDSWGDVIKEYPYKEQVNIKQGDIKTPNITTSSEGITELEIKDAEKMILYGIDKNDPELNKKLETLLKYKKFCEANNNKKAAKQAQDILSSFTEVLNQEQKIEIKKPVDNVSYTTIKEYKYNDAKFNMNAQEFIIKTGTKNVDNKSSEFLAQLCLEKIVVNINNQWFRTKNILNIIDDAEFKMLSQADGILDFISNKINKLPSGTDIRRGYIFTLSILSDVASATMNKDRGLTVDVAVFKERELLIKDFVEKEKLLDPIFKERIESKDNTENFKRTRDFVLKGKI